MPAAVVRKSIFDLLAYLQQNRIMTNIVATSANGEKDALSNRLFKSLIGESKETLSSKKFYDLLNHVGILADDPRLKHILPELKKTTSKAFLDGEITREKFKDVVNQNLLVSRALMKDLAIPNFEEFCSDISRIFDKVKANTNGKVADYIPQLARVEPEQFAVSVCTIDGQRFSVGDYDTNFGLQSTCKPINYCLAIEEYGEDKVHQHVGREPSGRSFNELSLNHDGLPHNPMINAGAIMCSSLIRAALDPADRFDYVFKAWKRLCANKNVSFNNAVYLSERQTADRNFALAYFMRENDAFPPGTKLMDTLEFYFQCCSIESCTHNLSIAAATMANGGVNPLTEEQIFSDTTVQHCLSLMLTCGMYDFSGEFAFKIGVPAKSGVSGAMLVIIPNVMGISIWSPRLDKLGNSVRGVEFCERLIKEYSFHNYDSLTKQTSKKNPRRAKYESKVNNIVNLIYAASSGDLRELNRLEVLGVQLDQADYDGRTALHLAASENQLEVARFLIKRDVDLEPKDRWGNTPLDDAKREGHQEIIRLLENHMVNQQTDSEEL